MWTDHLPFRSQIIGQRTSCSDNESMTLDDIGSCFIMVPKQKSPQWVLVVPCKRVLHGFVNLCSDHELHESSISQEANGYSLLCVEFLHMFGPSVLLLQRRQILMEPTFPSWPFWIFITLMLTKKYSGKPYPERSQCTLLQEAVFTPLAGCGAYHQEVSPPLWVAKATIGGCISGRLRPTHLVAQVDDSKTMGYVLTGRLLFWSRCI